MNTVQLKEDVCSNCKSSMVYGKKGEVVKVITDNPDVLIVEGKKGRFPVRKERVIQIN